MSELNRAETVQAQYATSTNLNTRISIHDQYSTNPLGFGNWIASQYQIEKGMNVLELGCGTGAIWRGRDDLIANCASLVLSDVSPGMLETARKALKGYDTIAYKIVDIQDIPFADNSFDIVIANMMLYHVPDLKKGLAEVRRVLKAGGTFYCATYGENGIMPYLCALLRPWGAKYTPNRNFTLQNGAVILREVFAEVRLLLYEDSLAVTHIEDIVDYIFSLPDIPGLHSIPRETILSVLSSNMENGVLNIPKEYGMFAAR